MSTRSYDDLLSTIRQSLDWWSPDREKAVLGPFTYTTAKPGKNIRGVLITAFNVWLNVPEEKIRVIERTIDMTHNATLMVDDIEDDSELRRGQPVAHKVYGVPETINSAIYVYFAAYRELASLRSSSEDQTWEKNPVKRLISLGNLDMIWNEELIKLHRGQGLDIIWRDSFHCPTEEEYIEMALGKASGLLRLSVKLMMACATTNVDTNYIPLMDLLGVYCQIRDDYMNLQSQEYTNTKGLADDISEGKFSFPVIHGIRQNPESTELMDILKQRPKTPTLKHKAISYLKDSTRSFDYTLSVMESLERQVRQEIARLGGNPILEALLGKLH